MVSTVFAIDRRNDLSAYRAPDGNAQTVNPYRIPTPALISFSGGRTSAYMLRHVLDAFGGQLPPDVHVAFANTGKEREATLQFVHECQTRWAVRVRWLEFVTDLASAGAAGRFQEVDYNSASRNGEPFDRLIERKQAIPSTVSGRWCTERLKVLVMKDFMETQGLKVGGYTECIGFRADEYDRVIELPMKPKNKSLHLVFPLSDAGVRKADVTRWWRQQPFDLHLQPGTGNCDHCPFVSRKNRIARARLDQNGTRWWSMHEDRLGGYSFGRESFADIQSHITANPILPIDDIDEDAADSECMGWCGHD